MGGGGESSGGEGEVDARERGGGGEDLRDGRPRRGCVRAGDGGVGRRVDGARFGVEREGLCGGWGAVLLRLFGQNQGF